MGLEDFLNGASQRGGKKLWPRTSNVNIQQPKKWMWEQLKNKIREFVCMSCPTGVAPCFDDKQSYEMVWRHLESHTPECYSVSYVGTQTTSFGEKQQLKIMWWQSRDSEPTTTGWSCPKHFSAHHARTS